MNTKQFRSWLQTHVETWRQASFPNVPAFYEGGDQPDLDKIDAIWIEVSIRWGGGSATSIGPRAPIRDIGLVKLVVHAKPMQGTETLDDLIDSAREYFRTNNRASEVRLHEPVKQSMPQVLGWLEAGVLIPFEANLS